MNFRQRTLKDILEDPMISEIAPDAISKWDLLKEDFSVMTIAEIEREKKWMNMDRGFEILFKAAASGRYYYNLYSEEERKADPDKVGRNIVFLPSQDKKAAERPFIFLTPGGAFINVWSLTEGWPVASLFNDLGYNVFILTYRVSTDCAAVKAVADVARAFDIIREHRAEFNVDPDKYITCGFSAGGYLVCLWNTEKGYRAYGIPKPQACFPIYPVTSYRILADQRVEEGGDKDEFVHRTLGCTLEEACNSAFEIPDHAEGFPPTAIFLAAEDELVDPEHSKRLAAALEKEGIPVYLEIGPTGGHGFADGSGMCMEGWPERAIRFYEEGN